MTLADRSVFWPGVPMALAAAVLFGAATPFAKLLLGTVEPQLLAGLLYLGAGIGLAAAHLGRAAFGIPAPEAPLRAGDLRWLAAVVVFGGVLGPLLLMLGLTRTAAAAGSLLLNLEGLFTMGIAWLVFRENVDRRLLLGALAILAGAAILSWGGRGFEVDTGGVLIAAACLAWGIDNNLTRKLSSADPVVTAMIKGLAAGTVNTGLAMLGGAAIPAAGESADRGRSKRRRSRPRRSRERRSRERRSQRHSARVPARQGERADGPAAVVDAADRDRARGQQGRGDGRA